MKGFMRDKKFHPIKPYSGITRKSRDQSLKTQGIRLQRRPILSSKSTPQLMNLLKDPSNNDADSRLIKAEVIQRKKRTVLQKNAGDIDWGFDLTDFEPEGFQKILKQLGIPQEYVRTWHEPDDFNKERQGRGFVWEGEGIIIETKNNPITGQYGNPKQREPEKNYAGYIGITGQPDQVKNAVKLIKKFGSAKDESPNSRDFI